MSRCQLCDRRGGDHRLDILSESGINAVNACTSCFEWAEGEFSEAPSVCIGCRTEATGKYEITEYGVPGDSAGICNDCRDRVLFDSRPLRENPADSEVSTE